MRGCNVLVFRDYMPFPDVLRYCLKCREYQVRRDMLGDWVCWGLRMRPLPKGRRSEIAKSGASASAGRKTDAKIDA